MILCDSWNYKNKTSVILDEMKLCTIPEDLSGILSAIQAQRQYFIQVCLFYLR